MFILKYYLFAGVNGSGKSFLYNRLKLTDTGVRINSDEIVQTLGHWSDIKVQFQAGKKAVQLIRDCIQKRVTFNQETTLTGYSIVKNIKETKRIGYKIIMFYIYLHSPIIAFQRIEQRVLNGGHGVSETDVKKRFKTSLDNLSRVGSLCDTLRIYDNSSVMTEMYNRVNGELLLFNKNMPEIVLNAVKQQQFEWEEHKKQTRLD